MIGLGFILALLYMALNLSLATRKLEKDLKEIQYKEWERRAREWAIRMQELHGRN